MNLFDLPVQNCVHSRFNTRKTRDADKIAALAERIRRNGFERTRALWAVEVDGWFEVFAGGPRLEAARQAGLETVPVFVFTRLSDAEISRKADQDNENDECHTPVGLLDVWAEYHRLWTDEGWTQQQIADAKGVSRQLVVNRTGWHLRLPECAKQAVSDGLLDEGHIEAVSTVMSDVGHFSAWLTTEQAQEELIAEVLSKFTGSSAGLKPTVKQFRETARRYKAFIAAADTAWSALPDDEPEWRELFVQQLANTKARSEAVVAAAFQEVSRKRQVRQQETIDRLRSEADIKEQEAVRLEQEQRRLDYVAAQTAKVRCGDARTLIEHAPQGFHLLLTDPPYGMGFKSNRRVATPKRDAIAGDVPQEAFTLLAEVLSKAYDRMADDATCLIFTGWRYEPEFRQVVQAAGFTIKGSLVWVKPNHGAGDLEGAFAPKHERILHAVKGNPKLFRREPDVLQGQERAGSEHPCEKPLDLLRQLIEATTEPGQVVVDPFFGSGGTLVSAFALGRDFYGCELDSQWHRLAEDAVFKKAVQEAVHVLAG